MAFDLDAALSEALRLDASDLHVKVPAAPRVRIAGKLYELPGYGGLTPEDTESVTARVITSDHKRAQFEEMGSADLSYFNGLGRFRVAAFSQRGSASFVFRAVPHVPETQHLGIPEVVLSWADAVRGLIVITGPTGSGKSTTGAAIIDLINRRRPVHILTIEDPIEYLHRDGAAIVCQREIGLDAPTYHTALRAALRQDPDVILIGEVRDEETAMTALRAAETGHLVLCTLHTLNAAETVQRFIDLFGERQTLLARQMLAGTLVGITSQRLVPGTDGRLKLNSEVLVNSARVRDLIANAASQSELRTAIREGDYYGMRSFDQCLLEKVREGEIARAEAVAFASDPHDFKLMMAGDEELSAAAEEESRQAADEATGQPTGPAGPDH
jgi:twitching motility protein PilT